MGENGQDQACFQRSVIRSFGFLETEHGVSLASTVYVDEGPRDSYYLAKYGKGELRVGIAWAPVELGLGVLMHLEAEGLGRRERSIHVEPFIEFLTDGRVVPIVPQIYPAMGVVGIVKTMEARTALFKDGYIRAMDHCGISSERLLPRNMLR